MTVFLGLCDISVAGGCVLELLACCEEHLDSTKLAAGPQIRIVGLLDKSVLD